MSPASSALRSTTSIRRSFWRRCNSLLPVVMSREGHHLHEHCFDHICRCPDGRSPRRAGTRRHRHRQGDPSGGNAVFAFPREGKPVTTAALRTAMTTSFGGSDAQGFWVWKDAYEALEITQVVFLRRFGPAILSRSTTPQATRAMTRLQAPCLQQLVAVRGRNSWCNAQKHCHR